MTVEQKPVRLAALRTLLDDPSPVVRSAVRDELNRMGQDGVAFLQSVVRSGDPVLRGVAGNLLSEIGGEDAVLRFREFIASFQYELETGSLILARAGMGDIDINASRAFLDEVAACCQSRLLGVVSPVEQCKVLNRVIFHEYEFGGDKANFYDPANSYLPMVIERRLGLPITLAILYLLIAERCDIQLEPVGVPGKFMVGCFADEEPFYIDVFEKGAFREQSDIHALLRSHDIPYDVSYYMPTPVGEVLCRCCRNLIVAYDRSGDENRRDLFRSFVDSFEEAYRRHAES